MVKFASAKLAPKSIIAFAVMPLVLLPAEAATIAPNSTTEAMVVDKNTPTHAVFLNCKLSGTRSYQSKGAILDLPEAMVNRKTDVALVTGHGLTKATDCYVSDFQGNTRKVLTKVCTSL